MKLGVVVLAALTLLGCANAKEVNAAFSRTQVTWSVFDPARTDGLRPLSGFEQGVNVTWAPRDRAVAATDALALEGRTGALAVSHLGLLVLDDSSGVLIASRPGALFPLSYYQTDKLFFWSGRLFVTLRQEYPPLQPPATLAWWSAGQSRVAFYPIPSQIKDPSRQAVGFDTPAPGSLLMTWKVPQGSGWTFETTLLSLGDGTETDADPVPEAAMKPDPGLAPLRARLAQRLGAGVAATAARGPGPALLFTASGWVAVGDSDGVRLYRLPELGVAGRYTSALALDKGYVLTWEAAYRGYAGAAGVVHVPFAVLAP